MLPSRSQPPPARHRLIDRLADVEVAVWTVRNHRLARLEMELSAIEIESEPCCQDSPMLSTMGLMIEPARHPPASRTHIRRQGSATMVTLGPALTLPCTGRR